MASITFPEDFIWGVATSSHQIEGAWGENGRGESIWDRFSSTPGKIEDGSDASRACDHYHRWREDVELLKWLGVNAYRFSIAWPRVLPDGKRGNPAGLAFYDRLIDALLGIDVQPFVTLYHWDLPQALQDEGGWANRKLIDDFAAYVDLVTGKLGDRVRNWITHNEPWCIAFLGHEIGEHAPGHQDPREALIVAHNLLVSHGEAVGIIRSNSPKASIGIVLNLVPAFATSPGEQDERAATIFDGIFNRWFLDPIFRGSYPQDAIAFRKKRGDLETDEPDFIKRGDFEKITAPVDFLGVNYYSRIVVRAGKDDAPVAVKVVPDEDLTEMGWEVYPEGLYLMLKRLKGEYGIGCVYITENGAAYSDRPGEDEKIHDERRIRYLRDHLVQAKRAMDDGVDLKGYFVWSLLDNFEWAHGYTKRFGLFWVDYLTQKRLPKDSAFWYRDVIAKRGFEIEDERLRI